MSAHSPTPWTLIPHREDRDDIWFEIQGADGVPVTLGRGVLTSEDAKHIVRCVNAHEALVEALIECRHVAAAMMRFVADQNNPNDGFADYMHRQGVKDGFGKRVEDVLASVGVDFAYAKGSDV